MIESVVRMQSGNASLFSPDYIRATNPGAERGRVDDAFFIQPRYWWVGKASSTLRSLR
jgi:hypothetical protein